jgi:outer membrane immunogenic protein
MRGIGAVAIILAGTAALPVFAADLPVGAPPAIPAAVPVPLSWTGCYVGGHLGGLVSQDKTTSLLGSSHSFSSAGFVGGGQIGCDYQFAPRWVLGVEGRAAWSSLTNSHASTIRNIATGITAPSQFTLGNNFLASTTARLGYSFADRWLVFARGGAAWTHEKIDEAFTAPILGIAVDPSQTMTRTGWTVGAGVDWGFAPHWSAAFEYNYYNFGSPGAFLTTPGNPVTVTIGGLKDTIHAVTVGVNYHF